MAKIPDHWSTQQALAVFDFICDLQQQIWDRYERPLVETILADLENEGASHQDPEDFDDDIPF
jgi:hypothetical protein